MYSNTLCYGRSVRCAGAGASHCIPSFSKAAGAAGGRRDTGSSDDGSGAFSSCCVVAFVVAPGAVSTEDLS